MQKEIKKRAQTYGILAIIFAALLGALCYNFGVIPLQVLLPMPQSVSASASSSFSRFSSYEELRSFLQKNSRVQGPYQLYGPLDSALMSPLMKSGETLGLPSFTFGSSDTEHSTTNVQVAGVDEADSVKTDGQYVYVLSGHNVYILMAYPPVAAQVLSKISFDDLIPVGIYVSGDRLAVLGCRYEYSGGLYTFPQSILGRSTFAPYIVNVGTFVNIYDISDRTKPTLLGDLTLTGSYFGSRMMGDYVYFVASESAYVINNDTVVLQKFYSRYGSKEIEPTEIHYINGSDDCFQYTTFVALNMQNTTETPTYMTLMLGGTSNMYMSLDNMYVTFHAWQGGTSIYRVHIADSTIVCEANGTVPGSVLNQFAMDEFNGYLRVVTTEWVNGTSRTNLYTLDMNLSTIGTLENLGLSENLHSTRFMGDRCYLVTFKKIDPLFVIDLSDPAHPKKLGELKIPGYSDYLHPYDENHIIGVGKETVEGNGGSFAWYQGVKISLFDVSNVSSPKQIANYTIGDRGTDSPILQDHKAFLFDKSRNLLVIPVLVAEINEAQYPKEVPSWAYGTPVWQGAYVFNLTLTDGFVLRGNVTHRSEGISINDESYWVKRALYIDSPSFGGVLYTVSDQLVRMNNLYDLAPINTIALQ